MPKFLVVVVAALGALVIWLAVETQGLRTEVAALQGEVQDLGRLGGRSTSRDALGQPEFLPAGPASVLPADGDATTGPSLAGPAADSKTVVRAVRDLQNRLESQERRLGGVEEKVEAAPKRPGGTSFVANRMIRDMDQAESVLDLSPRQRGDMERVVEDAKRDLEDLRSIPDDQGMTLAQVAKPRVVEGDGLKISMPNFGKIQKFMNQSVPGRSETYREAQDRITKQAKADVRDILEPEQRKTWDRSWTGGLLGPTNSGGFGMVTSSISIGGDAKDD